MLGVITEERMRHTFTSSINNASHIHDSLGSSHISTAGFGDKKSSFDPHSQEEDSRALQTTSDQTRNGATNVYADVTII